MQFILSALYFLLPAYIANMCPVIAGALKLPFGSPISTELFGNNKTWRGLLAGLLGAYLTLMLQQYFQSVGTAESLRILDYNALHLPFFSVLFGLGAIGGDMAKSFFKRKRGLPAGTSWFPFDQLDTLGALILLYPFVALDPWIIVTLVIITPLLHILVNLIGYALGLKKVWW